MSIIGFIGKIGTGKTTASKILEDLGYQKYAFAKTLKQWGLMAGFTEQQLYGTQEQKLEINKIHGVSGREWMQKTGESMRVNFPGFWVRVAKMQIAELKHVVLEDVRYQDEAKLIRDMGGILIRLNRDVETDTTIALHSSETEQNYIVVDYEIDNNHGIDFLKKEILKILNLKNTE